MPKPLYIYRSSNFCQPLTDTLPNLKPLLLEACGRNMRRIDRLTQLALIGSFQCKGQADFGENTGLYLSSTHSSLINIASVLGAIYQQGQFPRPLGFVNTVSNSACFYLAEHLGLLSNNQFVSRSDFSLEACIKLASIDLELGNIDAALLGIVSAAGENLAIHRERLDIDAQHELAEGSHWLYLAHEQKGELAMAEISCLMEAVTEPKLLAHLALELTDFDGKTLLATGSRVTLGQGQQYLQLIRAQAASFLPASARHECPTAMQVAGFLEQLKPGVKPQRLIHIDVDRRARYSLLVIDAIKPR